MFDFFFKRARAGSAAKADARPPAATSIVAPAAPDASQRRQQALDQAAALGADETAVLAFILSCPVPEARLRAAQQLHGRAFMKQAQKAMRETDRRVAKLMQQRLSALAHQELSERQMRAAIDRAQALLADTIVLPNQVVELDRAWAQAGSGSSALESGFAALRNELGERLQAQAALQRQVMDLTALLQASLSRAGDSTSSQLETALLNADAALREIEQDRALSSLPRHLMPELQAARSKLQAYQATLTANEAAVAAREQALDAWQSALADAGRAAAEQPSANDEAGEPGEPGANGDDAVAATPLREIPTLQSLRQQWRALPAVQDQEIDAALQARFETLLAGLAPAPLIKKKTRPLPETDRITAGAVDVALASDVNSADTAQTRALLAAALEELRSALDEGALQRAVEQDRLLRSLDGANAGLSSEQQHALSAARAELTRLQGWAKWGGTVSREELVLAVEGLPQQGLAVVELGKKVGSMRERWRALDATAGAAPRPLWLRFDAACSAAYAPVAAHFAELALQREARVEKAKAILAEVAAFVAGAGLGDEPRTDGQAAPAGAPDWRAIGAFCQRIELAWQRLGPLERKQQKQLNATFEQALQPLRRPLQAQQQQAIALREKLIAEVEQLAPQSRETLNRLQALQEQWQQHAKTLPLARTQEQQLWQRFRGACDAVFVQRKQAAASADAEREANLAAKTQLCTALERVLGETVLGDAECAVLLREQRLAWSALGPVPRAAQAALQTRFDQMLATLQAQRDAARQHASRVQSTVFEAALARCLVCERQLLSAANQDTQAVRSPWEPVAPLPAPLQQALQARFEAAQAALIGSDATYERRLRENQPVLDSALLRLEVALGLDSPPAFARERLQLQVAGLQSTFKSGSATVAADTPLLQLARACAVPALTDTGAENRIKAIASAVLLDK